MSAAAAFCRSSSVPSAKPFRLRRPVTASVGRRNRGAALAVEPPLRLMLKVDVAPPSEQDQSDVEGQRDRCDLRAWAENDLGAIELAEEGRSVADQQHDRGNHGSKHDPVVAGAVQRRAALQLEKARDHERRNTRLRLIICLTAWMLRLSKRRVVRTVGIEPTLPLREEDFKSPASTVPPRPQSARSPSGAAEPDRPIRR